MKCVLFFLQVLFEIILAVINMHLVNGRDVHRIVCMLLLWIFRYFCSTLAISGMFRQILIIFPSQILRKSVTLFSSCYMWTEKGRRLLNVSFAVLYAFLAFVLSYLVRFKPVSMGSDQIWWSNRDVSGGGDDDNDISIVAKPVLLHIGLILNRIKHGFRYFAKYSPHRRNLTISCGYRYRVFYIL
jgi:hypothetical protein